jgi:hypothetical protein
VREVEQIVADNSFRAIGFLGKRPYVTMGETLTLRSDLRELLA